MIENSFPELLLLDVRVGAAKSRAQFDSLEI
jgi:hypothetical protein